MNHLDTTDWTYISFNCEEQLTSVVQKYYNWLTITSNMTHWEEWRWHRLLGRIVGVCIKDPQAATLFKLKFPL